MSKALITTVPFGLKNRLPIELLEKAGIEYLVNPLNKKLTEDELADLVMDFDVIIAGTEPITKKVIDRASRLKLISRVGIGLDNIDLLYAKKRGVKISFTPDAPASAVAELTLGMMLILLRSVHVSNKQLHEGQWYRYFGRRLAKVDLGIIGVGRVGTLILKLLQGFGISQIMVNDLTPNLKLKPGYNLNWCSKEEIYRKADIISLHVPLTNLTNNMIQRENLLSMKPDAIIINTSRGGIINEQDLYEVMKTGHLGGSGIDVFEQEPYKGNLRKIERCLLTAHMGSMSIDCRTKMEIEATEEAIRFLTGKSLESEVPEDEVHSQKEGL